jgi:hypothetical protein
MASEGAIEVLIEVIADNEVDLIARQYCAMALGNLAAEPANHIEIVKSHGVQGSRVFVSTAVTCCLQEWTRWYL